MAGETVDRMEEPGKGKVREPVVKFAEQMEERLRENEGKGGWERADLWWLFRRVLDEICEVAEALSRSDLKRVGHECADAANFLMMIFDNVTRTSRSE